MSTHAATPPTAATVVPRLAERYPALVRDLELAEPLPTIPALDADGRRPERAWLLVRLFSEPLGLLELNLPDAGLTPADLANAVRDAYGERIRSRLALAGGWLAGGLPVEGVEVPQVPGFLQFRSRVWREGPPMTVVVCTRQRPKLLRRCLDSLLAQVYPDFRIVVVDNAPDDDSTARVVRAAQARGVIEYLVEPRPGLSHARNRALASVGDGILAFIDDDSVADPYWLLEVARGLIEHPEAEVICGAVVPAELRTQAQLWYEQFGGPTRARGYSPAVFGPDTAHRQDPLYPLPAFGSGANMTFRSGALVRIGGFDPALGAGSPARAGEDTLAFTQVLRTGGTIVYQPSALVRQYHPREVTRLCESLGGLGVGLTAVLTGLVLAEPRLLRRLLTLLPAALADLFGRDNLRRAGLPADFPAQARRANRRGLLRGPLAYWRGRRRARRTRHALR